MRRPILFSPQETHAVSEQRRLRLSLRRLQNDVFKLCIYWALYHLLYHIGTASYQANLCFRAVRYSLCSQT